MKANSYIAEVLCFVKAHTRTRALVKFFHGWNFLFRYDATLLLKKKNLVETR